jgi:hypothetical protein
MLCNPQDGNYERECQLTAISSLRPLRLCVKKTKPQNHKGHEVNTELHKELFSKESKEKKEKKNFTLNSQSAQRKCIP